MLAQNVPLRKQIRKVSLQEMWNEQKHSSCLIIQFPSALTGIKWLKFKLQESLIPCRFINPIFWSNSVDSKALCNNVTKKESYSSKLDFHLNTQKLWRESYKYGKKVTITQNKTCLFFYWEYNSSWQEWIAPLIQVRDRLSWILILLFLSCHLCFSTLCFHSPHICSFSCTHIKTANWVTQFCHFGT